MTAAAAPQGTPTLSAAQIGALRQSLLDWYAKAARALPWRASTDPYGIWISEIMCQQTQVATVKAYWTRWMTRFPDVQALAKAPEEEVMAQWAGLGYYRRARFLHKAAKQVVEVHHGMLPKDAAGLLKLPGVGRYTAGAIASIAYAEAAPLVDGNVERVFARLFAIAGDPKETPNQKIFWALAHTLVDPGAPGDFNQALMELGATVCTPKSPACLICPVRTHCQAFALGSPTTFPATVKRKKPRHVTLASLWIKHLDPDGGGTHYLLRRRQEEGLWGGLWEAPSSEPVTRQKHGGGAALDALKERLREWGLFDTLTRQHGELGWEKVGSFGHALSHLKMEVEVYGVSLGQQGGRENLRPSGATWRWVAADEVESIGLSVAGQKGWGLVKGGAFGLEKDA